MKTGPRKRSILAFIALALVCIAAVELAVCHHIDPELFRTITDPVVETVSKTASLISSTADNCVQYVRRVVADTMNEIETRRAQRELENTPPPEPEPEPPVEVIEEPDLFTELQINSEPLSIPPTPVCDPSVTNLQTVGDLQHLTGSLIEVVYFLQGDERWGELFYGSDKIGTHGCGPTAMAMVVSSMTDTVMDPLAMSQWAANHGHWARGSGSYHTIVMGISSDFGLNAESFVSRDADELREELLSGKLLVALMGPGHFTRGGHFIVLRGVTLSGDILVADPNSLERSLTAWDAQLILDELSKSTASGSPLWLISSPENAFLQ